MAEQFCLSVAVGVVKPGGKAAATPQQLLHCVELTKSRHRDVLGQLGLALAKASSAEEMEAG